MKAVSKMEELLVYVTFQVRVVDPLENIVSILEP